MSVSSLKAAGLGVAVAFPLVIASALARQPWARRAVPELEDVWQEQVQELKPAVCNMTGEQVSTPPPPLPPQHTTALIGTCASLLVHYCSYIASTLSPC